MIFLIKPALSKKASSVKKISLSIFSILLLATLGKLSASQENASLQQETDIRFYQLIDKIDTQLSNRKHKTANGHFPKNCERLFLRNQEGITIKYFFTDSHGDTTASVDVHGDYRSTHVKVSGIFSVDTREVKDCIWFEDKSNKKNLETRVSNFLDSIGFESVQENQI